jgi:membrane glycosyltransferase
MELIAGILLLFLEMLSNSPRDRAEVSWKEAWKKLAIASLLTLIVVVILLVAGLMFIGWLGLDQF